VNGGDTNNGGLPGDAGNVTIGNDFSCSDISTGNGGSALTNVTLSGQSSSKVQIKGDCVGRWNIRGGNGISGGPAQDFKVSGSLLNSLVQTGGSGTTSAGGSAGNISVTGESRGSITQSGGTSASAAGGSASNLNVNHHVLGSITSTGGNGGTNAGLPGNITIGGGNIESINHKYGTGGITVSTRFLTLSGNITIGTLDQSSSGDFRLRGGTASNTNTVVSIGQFLDKAVFYKNSGVASASQAANTTGSIYKYNKASDTWYRIAGAAI
jgi:hypothetical protein